MSTSTSYMATGTCAVSERGRGLQNWAAFIQQMEVVREMWNVVKSNLEGGVIRPDGANTGTFSVHITNYKRLRYLLCMLSGWQIVQNKENVTNLRIFTSYRTF